MKRERARPGWLGRSPKRALVGCLVVTLALGAACKGKTEVSFGVSIPSAVAESVRWIEIGAFRDTKCGALLPMLGGGMPDGATKRFAFGRDGSAAPRVGDLSRASYAFAGVAKGEDCAVLATGCIEANLEDFATEGRIAASSTVRRLARR